MDQHLHCVITEYELPTYQGTMRLQKLALLWMLEEKIGNFGKGKSRKIRKKKKSEIRKKKVGKFGKRKSRKIWKRKTVAKDKRKNRKI